MGLYIGNTRYCLVIGKVDSLPYDAEIEYLQSTGTQFVDTWVMPTADTGVHTKVVCSNNTDSYIFGLRNDSGNTRWCIGHSSNGFYYGYGTTQPSDTRLVDSAAELWLNYLNNKKCTESNNGTTKEVSLPTLSFSPLRNIRIFGSSQPNSNPTWSGKIYYFQISHGQNVIMDLIPVRVGQVGYMYDKISGALLGNKGTGNFTLGPDIT